MPSKLSTLEILPLDASLRKESCIGAEVVLPSHMPLLQVDRLTQSEIEHLRKGLYEHGVLVIRQQKGISAETLPQLGKLFDSTALEMHSSGAKAVTDPKNILSAAANVRLPSTPQVTVIGQGQFEHYEGIENFRVRHVDHVEFHETPLSDAELEAGYTRPYRFHMDAPLYENLPGQVTILHSLINPDLPDQRILFPNGQCMDLAAGATAFFSGARSFELLSEEEQDFALRTTVNYAPRAYEWMRDCKATSDGLTIASPGREKALDELTAWEWDKVQCFPMVWQNPGTGRPHLQVLGCCVYSLTTVNPSTGEKQMISDVAEARRICHGLQKKVYTPQNIYAHRWKEGDLVIFHNQGVLHSITGQLAGKRARRLFWQCNLGSKTAPEGFA